MKITLEPIGIIHSCYPEKFGIPRQPGLVKSAVARLVLLEPYNRIEMVRGLEEYSHIWIQFLFHQTLEEGWRTTVRPPMLGGKKRVGVFSSRSPHRPNHLGMSAVQLTGIVSEGKELFLELAGVDLVDQTPVVDIKPYISYSDRIEGTMDGAASPPDPCCPVEFIDEAEDFCRKYEARSGCALRMLIRETIGHDPRPAAHRQIEREYGMHLWDLNVRFIKKENTFKVVAVHYQHSSRL